MKGYPEIIKGATSILVIPVTGDNLSNYQFFVDIKSGPAPITIEAEYNSLEGTVSAFLTQANSLSLKKGTATMQVRAINSYGEVVATEMYGVDIADSIFSSTVTYAEAI